MALYVFTNTLFFFQYYTESRDIAQPNLELDPPAEQNIPIFDDQENALPAPEEEPGQDLTGNEFEEVPEENTAQEQVGVGTGCSEV